MLVNILLWCLFGLIAGMVAQYIMPGKDPGESGGPKGLPITILLGIAGAVVGGLIGNALGLGGAPVAGGAPGATAPDILDWRSMLLAVGGALLLLLAYRAIRMLIGAAEPGATAYGLRRVGAESDATTTNLTDLIKNAVTPDAVHKLSSAVGESPSNTRKALDAMIPTILAGAASQAATPSGAARLFEMAKESTEGGTNLLSNLAGHLTGAGLENLSRTGHGILSAIFGDKLNDLLSWLAKFAGIESGSASSLMGVASNLVMNALGTQSLQNGFSASGLSNLLSGQKNWLARLLPAGVSEVPGLNALKDYAGQAGAAVRDAAGDGGRAVAGAARDAYRAGVGAAQEVKPWLSALAPLLLIGLAVAALPFVTRGCATKEMPVVRAPDVRGPNVTPADGKGLGTRVAAYGPDLGKLVTLTLPDGVSLEVPEASFLHGLHRYLADAADTGTRVVVFEHLTFDGPAVTAAPETETAVKVLAALLKAFPGVTLHITGHTDNAGDPDGNRRLSLDRANAVKDLLVKAGGPADRISTEGLGADKPVAPNDGDENRAKNRRVELTVAKK
jgi:outer membrane protein OmpA-like peptidoglycan-associated protein/uncharacterized membrane protein YeaQ/YmgE (transglycosylase-associated protein family)